MMTHEFIDEDADLACPDLSDWEKQFFAEIGDKINENNGNESDKENEEEKEETEEEITFSPLDGTYCMGTHSFLQPYMHFCVNLGRF